MAADGGYKNSQHQISVHNINNFFAKTLLNYTFFKRSWHHKEGTITYIDLVFLFLT